MVKWILLRAPVTVLLGYGPQCGAILRGLSEQGRIVCATVFVGRERVFEVRVIDAPVRLPHTVDVGGLLSAPLPTTAKIFRYPIIVMSDKHKNFLSSDKISLDI